MADEKEKIFSVQPKFKIGDTPSVGWALVDGIFKMGSDVPKYGTAMRDAYLARAWVDEPMLAGVMSTWVEKAQTISWKITGGKNLANYYANMLHGADGGRGWTYHEGVSSLDYLTTDKGCIEELGRDSFDKDSVQKLRTFNPGSTSFGYEDLRKLTTDLTSGRVSGLQHLDATRMIKVGLPGMRWKYYPEHADPIYIPDGNIVQTQSLPAAQDRFAGYGHCAMSRLLDAKKLMLGYLHYHRQEIGNLPPELVAIINGMSAMAFEDALAKYKQDKSAANLDEYGKIFWLGSDDPMTPVSLSTTSLTTSNKSFSYQTMIEWWIKLLALNTGESVGEYWLVQQSGAAKSVESIQALKAKAKGVSKYIQEKERLYNAYIMPIGMKFEYDNTDDDQDQIREDILAAKIRNLAAISSLGIDRQDPVYTLDQIRALALKWDIIPPELTDAELPTAMGAVLKDLYSSEAEPRVSVYSTGDVRVHKPLLTSNKDQQAAEVAYKALESIYFNGHMRHKQIDGEVIKL